jgi:hypothetical protein
MGSIALTDTRQHAPPAYFKTGAGATIGLKKRPHSCKSFLPI